jgi:predicted permease
MTTVEDPMRRNHDASSAESGSGLTTSLLDDLRIGVRVLRSTPLVASVAVLSLALGTGATTAIVSILNSLLLRNLPVSAPDRLGVVSTASDANRGQTPGWTYATWREIQRHTAMFDGMSALAGTRFTTTLSGETQFAEGLYASGDLFSTLGVEPLLGRTLTAADDVQGGGSDGPVAVISYNYWQRRLGASPNVVGQRLTLDRVPFTIVGVTPPAFFGVEIGRSFDVAVPLATEPLIRGGDSLLTSASDRWLTALLRVKASQSLETATAALRTLQPSIRQAALPPPQFARLRQDFLKEPFTIVAAGQGTSGLRLRERYTRPLLVVLVVVGLVLLIACANIANLQLARTADRQREFSLRVALGSSRWRLARQLFVESALLATAGAGLGALLGAWGSRMLVAQLSSSVSRVDLDLSFDWRVLGFMIALTAVTTLMFGTVPALRASRVAPADALRRREHGLAVGRRRIMSGGLVAAQIALCVVLVVTAGLFIRTLERLNQVPLGFDSDGVLVLDINATRAGVMPDERAALYQRLVAAAATVPGVEHAAAALVTPIDQGFFPLTVDNAGGTDIPGAGQVVGTFITPQWFSSYGIPIRRGRDLDDGDTAGAPLVAVVNAAFARESFPGREALGQPVEVSGGRGDLKLGRRTIVGVVGDSLSGAIRDGVKPTIYFPLTQWNVPLPVPPRVSISLSRGAPSALPSQLVRGATAALAAVNGNVDMRVRQIGDEVRASLAQERLIAMLSGFFGVLALVLAALGLYGVTAHSVARRRSELGVRLALGAPSGSIVTLVLRRLMLLVAVGLVLGVGGSFVLSRFIGALLYSVDPRDALTLVTSAAAVAVIAVLAAGVPAIRSSHIDPGQVLRES